MVHNFILLKAHVPTRIKTMSKPRTIMKLDIKDIDEECMIILLSPSTA
jgi:hypothetical protein